MYNQLVQNNCTKTFPGGLKQQMSSDRQLSHYPAPALPNHDCSCFPKQPHQQLPRAELESLAEDESCLCLFVSQLQVRLLASGTKVKLTGHLDFGEGNSTLTSKSQSQNSSDEEQSLTAHPSLLIEGTEILQTRSTIGAEWQLNKSCLCYRIPSLKIRFAWEKERSFPVQDCSLTTKINITTRDFCLMKFVIGRPQNLEKSQD